MLGNRHALRSTAAARRHHRRTLPMRRARTHRRRSCLMPHAQTRPAPSTRHRQPTRIHEQSDHQPGCRLIQLTGKLARDPELPAPRPIQRRNCRDLDSALWPKRLESNPSNHRTRPAGYPLSLARLQAIHADRRRPSFSSARPVTPEVAGSSPVAPACFAKPCKSAGFTEPLV